MKTRQTYVTAQKLYTKFCDWEAIHPAFPASLPVLTSWVATLGDRDLQVKMIKAYLIGLRLVYVDMGYIDLSVFQNPLLQRIIAGIRRMRGEAEIKERRPII